MLLGKRPRHPIKRTTSMTEFAFDPSSAPTPVEFAVSPPAPPPDLSVSATDAASVVPDQRTVAATAALVSPRLMQRRFSADFDGRNPAASHFLRSCSLCKRHFIPGRDIYMYRGDMAFCSLECRQQQMSQDERKERCSAAPGKKASSGSAPAARAKAKATAKTEGETVAAV